MRCTCSGNLGHGPGANGSTILAGTTWNLADGDAQANVRYGSLKASSRFASE